jgi:hypothetical protein
MGSIVLWVCTGHRVLLLEVAVKSVLHGLHKDSAEWELHAAVVEEAAADPSNHPADCRCSGCVPL